MRKNIRDTIRRPKDYERDPSWDSEGAEIYSEEIDDDEEKAEILEELNEK